MINIAKRVKSSINVISPYLPIILKLYDSQENQYGKIVSNYIYIETQANIQSTNKKELKDINGISVSDSFLTFYIIEKDLSTVDRVIKKGTDFIIFNNITYKVVKVLENFNTGWISLIASEYKEGN